MQRRLWRRQEQLSGREGSKGRALRPAAKAVCRPSALDCESVLLTKGVLAEGLVEYQSV